MIYKIIPTSQKNQVLLESVERRNGNKSIAAVSLQMDENKAKQIIAVFDFVNAIATLTDKDIETICLGNVKTTIDALRNNARKIIK